MSGPVRLGLACTGWIANWAVHDAIARGADATVVFAASRSPSRAAAYAQAHGIPRHGLWCDLLERDDVDAVYIAVPNSLHGPHAMDAIRAGKHVLCEKPIAREAATARALAAEAEAHGVLLWEAMHYRCHDDVRAAVDALPGEIGPVESVDVEFSYHFPPSGDIRYRPDLHGGALMDIGCYALDFMQWVFGGGEVTAADAAHGDVVDVAATLSWSAPSGAGTARVSFLEPGFTCKATAAGPRGTARFEHMFLPVVPGPPPSARFTATVGTRAFAAAAGGRTSYEGQLSAFAAAIGAGAVGAPSEVVTRAAALEAAYTQSLASVRSLT